MAVITKISGAGADSDTKLLTYDMLENYAYSAESTSISVSSSRSSAQTTCCCCCCLAAFAALFPSAEREAKSVSAALLRESESASESEL